MAKTRITEFKISAGKDVIIFEPTEASWVISGKSGRLPGKLAVKLFKTIAGQVEPYFELLKNTKETDFNA